MNEYSGETAELTLSLDVIFHLIEDNVFIAYMERLFDSSTKFVIIYAFDTDDIVYDPQHPQLKHRKFSKWIDENRPHWKLFEHIPNRYPFKTDPYTESFSDFYIYSKIIDT